MWRSSTASGVVVNLNGLCGLLSSVLGSWSVSHFSSLEGTGTQAPRKRKPAQPAQPTTDLEETVEQVHWLASHAESNAGHKDQLPLFVPAQYIINLAQHVSALPASGSALAPVVGVCLNGPVTGWVVSHDLSL